MRVYKTLGVIARFAVIITIACEFVAYGQMAGRKPLPEDHLPIPDYYGLYAVTDKGLLEMKPNGHQINVGTDVEFIFYAKNASAAESFELYRLPTKDARNDKPKNDGKYKGLNDFMQQGENNYMANRAALEGMTQGSTLIEMREKSITGKPEMVRLIPASILSSGDYQIGVRSLGANWCHFSVSGGNGDGASPNLPGSALGTQTSASISDVIGNNSKNGTYHGVKVDASTAADLYEDAAVSQESSFDNHVREYPYAYEQVWDAVSSLLKKQNENMLKSDKVTGILETKMTKRGTMFTLCWEKLYLVVEKSGNVSTKVSFKLFRFDQVNDYEKGVGHLISIDKNKVNPKAEAFLDRLDKQLKSIK